MGDTNVGLEQAVGPAFPRSVEKKDDGPFLLGMKIGRNIDLVAISDAGCGDGAVEETGLHPAEGRKGGEQNQQEIQA
jgi:hypothetical protein